MTLDELYDRLAALRAAGYGGNKVMVEADQANGAPFLRRELDDVGAIRGELVLLCSDPEPVENANPKPLEDTSLQDCRQEYVRLREKAMEAGVRSRKGFETLCRRYLRAPATPEAWVAAAREVAHDWRQAHGETEIEALVAALEAAETQGVEE